MHLARVLRSSAQLQPGCLGVGPVSPVQLSWGLQGWRGQGVPRPYLAAGVIQSAEGAIGLGQMSSDSHAPGLCGVANEGLLLLENQPPGQRRCPGQATGLQGAGVGCSGRDKGGSWKLRASILGVAPPFTHASTELALGFTKESEGQDTLVTHGLLSQNTATQDMVRPLFP